LPCTWNDGSEAEHGSSPPAVIESGASTERRLGQPFPSGHRGRIGSPEPNRDVALVVEARARLDSFGFSPRLDDGEEFYGVRFRADFYVAELTEACGLSSDNRYSSLVRLRARRVHLVPTIRALFEATYDVGLHKAGMPEE